MSARQVGWILALSVLGAMPQAGRSGDRAWRPHTAPAATIGQPVGLGQPVSLGSALPPPRIVRATFEGPGVSVPPPIMLQPDPASGAAGLPTTTVVLQGPPPVPPPETGATFSGIPGLEG